jgi:CheY-like chemotaxis protein
MKPIVIVEDDETVLGMIVRMLAREGYSNVRTASSVEAAERLRTVQPALVICDNVLEQDERHNPVRTHHEVVAIWPDTPCVIVSGYPPSDPAYFEVAKDVYHAPPPHPRCWMMKPILGDRIGLAVRTVIGLPEPT